MTKFTAMEGEIIGCSDLQCENRTQVSQNVQNDNGAVGTSGTPTPFSSSVESSENPENINGNPYGFECEEQLTLPGKSSDIIHLEEGVRNDGTTENNAALSPSTSEDNVGASQTNVSLDDYKCPICLDIFINVSSHEYIRSAFSNPPN